LDDGRIVRILLDRPDTRNAQNRGLLVELDDAFRRAEEDDRVRVVILAAPAPSSRPGTTWARQAQEEWATHRTNKINGATRPGAERACCRSGTTTSRTPALAQPPQDHIAQVQGTVYAPPHAHVACDLIVGAENVLFADVVGTRLGMCGSSTSGTPGSSAPQDQRAHADGDAIDVHEAHRLEWSARSSPPTSSRTGRRLRRRIAELPP